MLLLFLNQFLKAIMNKLEEQLEHLNYQVELHIAKRKGGAVGGNKDIGHSVCCCSSERFINYSYQQKHTRAAFVSTWLIGFNAAVTNRLFYDRYNFLRLSSHAICDDACPSWIVSPPFSKKTFYDYTLMWDCFEEALAVYKKECRNHKEMYLGMAESINKMEDEDARGSLTAALEYVFEDDLEYLKAPYPTFSRT